MGSLWQCWNLQTSVQQRTLSSLPSVSSLQHAANTQRSLGLLLQEIKAVDRVFPALDQVEKQLACRHVLEPVLTAVDDEATTPSPAPLQMTESQTPPTTAAHGEANGTSSNGTSSNGTSSNGAQSKDHQEWSQDRGGLDKWILTNLNDGQRRLKMVKALTNLAKPFQYGASTVMQALGDLYSVLKVESRLRMCVRNGQHALL